MKKGLMLTITLLALLALSGCDTWEGAKKDTNESVQWGKDKVNDGAKYIEKKTE